ncbi:MAG TPA: hypothetical protein VF365_09125 [Candidatus Limnocylindria bacterium]
MFQASVSPLRWAIATVAFAIGGYLGHLVAGPAATVPAALISGVVAGAVIGAAQGAALGFAPRELSLWAGGTGLGLAASLAAVTAFIGQIDTTSDAVLLGAVSGLTVGAAQAAVLARGDLAHAAVWMAASGIAWALGWLTTASIGVALAAGWPVYGMSGAIVSQLITGVVLWRLASRREATPAPA